jgi:hypothetical protein
VFIFQLVIIINKLRIHLKPYDTHRLSINRPTKDGKEKSPSDGHSMPKRDGRPFTDVSTILDRELHSDPIC